jgi:hypothetical protein
LLRKIARDLAATRTTEMLRRDGMLVALSAPTNTWARRCHSLRTFLHWLTTPALSPSEANRLFHENEERTELAEDLNQQICDREDEIASLKAQLTAASIPF